MKRLAIVVCLALATTSCTDKSAPAESAAKKPKPQQTTSVAPVPNLPAPFALERSVRNQLNQQKRQARQRADQLNQVIGR